MYIFLTLNIFKGVVSPFQLHQEHFLFDLYDRMLNQPVNEINREHKTIVKTYIFFHLDFKSLIFWHQWEIKKMKRSLFCFCSIFLRNIWPKNVQNSYFLQFWPQKVVFFIYKNIILLEDFENKFKEKFQITW